jgi:hypothetical protein
MTKPKNKTLERCRQAKGRGWLANLTPEERATCEAVRAEHQGPNGPLNIEATLRILPDDLKKRVVSSRTFGPWMNTNPDGSRCVRGFAAATEGGEE